MLKVTIDGKSGCCNGVRRAIEQAENWLRGGKPLYCLGAIVHNDVEIARLTAMGMQTVSSLEYASLRDATVLIRAHGEPPETYLTAERNHLKLIDCTCPVVLKIQREIASVYRELKASSGQIIIFGKRGHAEVNGLVGQAGGNAIVVENLQDLATQVADGRIKSSVPTAVFSQTTKDLDEYKELCWILERVCCDITVHNTICSQVSSRHPNLKVFASTNDVIVFVSGRESSNGRILFELCRSVNPRSYMVEYPEEIGPEWFDGQKSVGICGATSTPRRQLEECASYIVKLSDRMA